MKTMLETARTPSPEGTMPSVGGVRPGQSVYVNMMRATSGKAGDIRVWSPTFGNFHSLDPLGEVILE